MVFSLVSPLWSGLSVSLIEAFIQSVCVSYTGSSTWQWEIIFTHWQLWLSGLRSAKKCFTQMARERTWRLDDGGWFLHLLTGLGIIALWIFPFSGLMCACWHVCGPYMSVNASLQCEYTACVSISDSCSLRKLHRHCEDSAGSSVPFVFARSSFPPTVGRQAGRQARLAAGLAFTGWLG